MARRALGAQAQVDQIQLALAFKAELAAMGLAEVAFQRGQIVCGLVWKRQRDLIAHEADAQVNRALKDHIVGRNALRGEFLARLLLELAINVHNLGGS